MKEQREHRHKGFSTPGSMENSVVAGASRSGEEHQGQFLVAAGIFSRACVPVFLSKEQLCFENRAAIFGKVIKVLEHSPSLLLSFQKMIDCDC